MIKDLFVLNESTHDVPRFDLENKFVKIGLLRKSKRKAYQYLVMIGLWIYSFHWIIWFLGDKNDEKFHLYYADYSVYMGGARNYYLLIPTIWSIQSSIMITIYCLIPDEDISLQWFDILRIFNDVAPYWVTYELSERSFFKLWRRAYQIKTIANIVVNIGSLAATVIVSVPFIISWTMEHFLLYALPWAIYRILFFNIATKILIYMFFYFDIICYFYSLKFEEINEKIIQILNYPKMDSKILDILIQHNKCSKSFVNSRILWKKIIFIILFGCFTNNLFIMYVLFFTDAEWFVLSVFYLAWIANSIALMFIILPASLLWNQVWL